MTVSELRQLLEKYDGHVRIARYTKKAPIEIDDLDPGEFDVEFEDVDGCVHHRTVQGVILS